MKKIIGLLFVALWMLSGMAAAEEKELGFWADPNYDFSQVRRVCIMNPDFSQEIKAEDTDALRKLLLKNAKLRNVKVLTMNDVIELIKKERGVDIRQLTTNNEGGRIFLEQLPKYADLMIDARIVRCGIVVRDSEMVSAEVETVDSAEPIYFGDEIRDYKYTYKKSKVRLSGGRGEPLITAKIDWNVYDLRMNKAVIVSTQEGSVPMKIGSGEYGLGGLDLSKRMPGFTPQRICEMTIQSFFGELSTRINGQ